MGKDCQFSFIVTDYNSTVGYLLCVVLPFMCDAGKSFCWWKRCGTVMSVPVCCVAFSDGKKSESMHMTLSPLFSSVCRNCWNIRLSTLASVCLLCLAPIWEYCLVCFWQF